MSSVELRRVLFVFLSPHNKAAAQKTDGAESIQLKLMESGYPHKSLHKKKERLFFFSASCVQDVCCLERNLVHIRDRKL